MNFFYDIDSEIYISEKDIKREWYDNNREEYPDYSHYLLCCMTSENGSLETLQQRENYLQRELNRLKKQDYDTISDQVYYQNELTRINLIKETGNALEVLKKLYSIYFENDIAWDTLESLIEETEKQMKYLLTEE